MQIWAVFGAAVIITAGVVATITADVKIDVVAKLREMNVKRKEEKLTAQVFGMAATALPAGAVMMTVNEMNVE
ncbi:hypothetical protein [Lacrimispora sphenoides]|uniref:hypothetical protein n=1 Tax=Lacrimispora sphenoides TaxID=29370 RepID=UPI000A88E8CB|nr:hypothetical protein [Lacrimispora sphenoides]